MKTATNPTRYFGRNRRPISTPAAVSAANAARFTRGYAISDARAEREAAIRAGVIAIPAARSFDRPADTSATLAEATARS